MKPSTRIREGTPRTVHILAQDEALGSSLAFALGLMKFEAVHADTLGSVLRGNQLCNQDVILIDCSLITSIEASLLTELRRGWRGTLVVMAEDESGCPACSDGVYEARLLVKPFALDDVVAALDFEPRTTDFERAGSSPANA